MVPTEMIAVGDQGRNMRDGLFGGGSLILTDSVPYMGDGTYGPSKYGISGFGWPGVPGSMHRDRRSNAVFCDDHVESTKRIQEVKDAFANPYFKPNAAHDSRWNNDNQPHRETWPR